MQIQSKPSRTIRCSKAGSRLSKGARLGSVLLLLVGSCPVAAAQDEPTVLIDATPLPPPDDGLGTQALKLRAEKEAAAGRDGGAEAVQSGPRRAPVEASRPPLPPPARVDKALPACLGIVVRSSNGQLFADSFESGGVSAWGQEDAVLSADRVPDLLFDIYFDGQLSGEHVLHLRWTTPRGHHYQTKSTPIASDTSLQGAQRRLDGHPFAVDVEVLRSVGGALSSASLRLPVAGTSIVTHRLYGRWTVEAFVDQQDETCGPAGEFVLVP